MTDGPIQFDPNRKRRPLSPEEFFRKANNEENPDEMGMLIDFQQRRFRKEITHILQVAIRSLTTFMLGAATIGATSPTVMANFALNGMPPIHMILNQTEFKPKRDEDKN